MRDDQHRQPRSSDHWMKVEAWFEEEGSEPSGPVFNEDPIEEGQRGFGKIDFAFACVAMLAIVTAVASAVWLDLTR